MLGAKAAMILAMAGGLLGGLPEMPLRREVRRGFRYRIVYLDGIDCVISDDIPRAAPFESFREGYERHRAAERRRVREEREEQDRVFREKHGRWPWEPDPETVRQREAARRKLKESRKQREEERRLDWKKAQEAKAAKKRDEKISGREKQLARRRSRKGRK